LFEWDDEDTWMEIRAKACRVNEDWWQCETFERLEDGAIMFLVFEVISMCLTLFLITKFFLLALKILDVLWDLLYIFIAIAGAVFHVLAVVTWFGVTEAVFECDESDPDEFDDFVDICASAGPGTHMVLCIP
jgi:fumarate reductase subunit C